MTLRRIDPWSVLKFGAVVNVCLLVIALLGFGILWFAIRQLGVIDQACDLATDVGFESCAINGGNLFRYVFLLGLLWVVIQTGLLVFFAFLHNLISDLVGGIEITLSEEGGGAPMTSRTSRTERTEDRRDGPLGTPPPRDEQRTEPSARNTASAASGSAVARSTSGDNPGSGSGNESDDRPERAPSAPPTAAPRSSERAPTGSSWPWDPQSSRSGSSSSESRPQERPDQERSGPDSTEERRSADRGDDNLFGRRDR